MASLLLGLPIDPANGVRVEIDNQRSQFEDVMAANLFSYLAWLEMELPQPSPLNVGRDVVRRRSWEKCQTATDFAVKSLRGIFNADG